MVKFFGAVWFLINRITQLRIMKVTFICKRLTKTPLLREIWETSFKSLFGKSGHRIMKKISHLRTQISSLDNSQIILMRITDFPGGGTCL